MAGDSKKPFVLGLTGGIGSGKSSAMRTLVALGAEGIDADRVAHTVIEPGEAAHDTLVAAFGPGVLAADGQVDRKRLGQQVFEDPAALARLEAIVHPAVAEAIRQRVAASRVPMVVIEAIKLLEAGLSRALCDQVWVTSARPEQQVARLIAGRGMTVAEIERRMAAQMSPAQMAEQADRIIDTSGTLSETALQVLRGWSELGLPLPAPQVRLGTAHDAEAIAAVLNGVVHEGGLTVMDHSFTVEEERDFLQRLPRRARVMVLTLAGVVCGFQVIEPYASYTGAMDHVASLGSFVASGLRCHGLGHGLAAVTLPVARNLDFAKIVINVRADNPGAQEFYASLGFQPCGRLVRQAFIDGHYVDELLYELLLSE
jgi:dephospho-CoA kinase